MLLNPTGSRSQVQTSEKNKMPFKWQECLASLGKEQGKTDAEIRNLIQVISRGSLSGDGSFLSLVVAIIAVESQFNAAAISSSGAVGLMQVTTIGAIEAERQCPRLAKMGNEHGRHPAIKLLDPVNNVRYGTCLLTHYMSETNDSVFLGLVLYNGGFKQLTRLIKDATLVNETQQYVFRVHQQLGRCQQ